MTLTALALPLAYLGSLLGVIMVVPQILRTLRNRTLEGVSALSWALVALACSAWLVYGVHAHVLPQIPGNVLLVSGAWAIVLLVPHRLAPWRRAVMLGSATGVMVVVSWLLPPTSGGYLAFALGLTAVWPQVAETWVNRHDDTSSGLSLPSWGLKAGSQLCWLSYALLAVDVPVMFSALVALASTGFVLGVEAARRSRVRPAAARELVCEPA